MVAGVLALYLIHWRTAILLQAYLDLKMYSMPIDEPNDDDLLQLALEAQRHPARSVQRKQALGKLWYRLEPVLDRYRNRYQNRVPRCLDYQEVYNEAEANLMEFICSNIEKYNPQRASVINWAKDLLKYRIRDVVKYFMKDTQIRQRPTLSEFGEINTLDKANPENISQDEPKLLSEMVRECLESDPEGIFQATHIEGYPKATYQTIALLYLDKFTLRDIATKFGIRSQYTISSFLKRNTKKFIKIFQEWIYE